MSVLSMSGVGISFGATELLKEITFTVGKTGSRTMTAEAYVKTWATANMYFHITTAYNILRHNGVAVGKMDFLGGQ